MALSMAQDASGATVAVATSTGAADVRFDVVPDDAGADRVQRTLRYCSFVRLSCADGRWTSRVHGFGHHRPTELQVSMATALGMLRRGVPCLMRVA